MLYRSEPTPSHTQAVKCNTEQSNFRSLRYILIFSLYCFVRWEEEKYEDGVKWKFLEHKGPYFPPEYQPIPDDVHFHYDGEWSVERGD